MVNDVEQYGRRWLLRIHGAPTQENENCVETCKALFNNKLSVNVESSDIEAAHRLRPRNDGRPPAIIVRFQRRDKRQLVIQERRKLKGSGISISEDLTALNMKLLNRVQNHDGISQSWSSNGNIFGIPVGSRAKIKFQLFKPIDETINEYLTNAQIRRSQRQRGATTTPTAAQ